MYLTQKVRIKVTPEQEDVLWHLSERCRLLYNFALAERIDAWKNQTKGMNLLKQLYDLPGLRKKYPEYKWLHSNTLRMTLITLNANYRSFFSLQRNGDTNANPPGFKGRKYFCTLKYRKVGFKTEPGKILLKHFHNGVPLVFDIPEKFKFDHVYQVEVFQKQCDFYLSIIYRAPELKYINNGLYQAWDLGIEKQTGVNLSGKFVEIKNPRPDKYWNKPVSELQSRRDHCKRGSRRWRFLNGLKRKCEDKKSNQLKDFQHKSSKKLVLNTKSNNIILGDLSVKKMAQSDNAHPRMNRSTQGTGYLGRFADFVTYKSQLAGKKTIRNSERNSSKRCCCCGKLHDMPPWKRTMKCDCGNVLDRDRNAAVNQMLDFLSQNAIWTGYWQFVGNLRQTGLSISDTRHSQGTLCASMG